MADTKDLENAVKALAPHDLAAFRRWFAEFDGAAWDEQIERDLASGRLDQLLAEAQSDRQAGGQRPL